MHIRPIKTQQIDDCLYVIRTGMSNFYIYNNGSECICFDTGYLPGVIRKAISKFGIVPDNVSHVFLTHSDYDHVGGLRVFSKAKVYLSKLEEKMITYKKPRLLLLFNKRIRSPYEMLEDNDIVQIGEVRIRAISTPGHTIGSMSYLLNDKYLFTGDALTVGNNNIKPFFLLQNMNAKEDKQSTNKIKAMAGTKVICTGHSGYMLKED